MATSDQIAAINIQLAASQEQTAMLSKALESLRTDAEGAIRDLRNLLAEEQRKGTAAKRSEKPLSFINSKNFEGGKFSGAKFENSRAWSKKVKIFCNTQYRGFRKALTNAEECKDRVGIENLDLPSWDFATDVNEKFSDFLHTYTSDDAMRIVEAYPDQGSEAWRQLKLRYNPPGVVRILTAP